MLNFYPNKDGFRKMENRWELSATTDDPEPDHTVADVVESIP